MISNWCLSTKCPYRREKKSFLNRNGFEIQEVIAIGVTGDDGTTMYWRYVSFLAWSLIDEEPVSDSDMHKSAFKSFLVSRTHMICHMMVSHDIDCDS